MVPLNLYLEVVSCGYDFIATNIAVQEKLRVEPYLIFLNGESSD